MKFLIDAQLPRQMVSWFAAAGCDACHTLELPLSNRTPDNDIIDLTVREQRVLATKDGDFVDSHLLSARPEKLLLVTTGNISNQALEKLVVPLISRIDTEFQQHSFFGTGAVRNHHPRMMRVARRHLGIIASAGECCVRTVPEAAAAALIFLGV